MKSLEHKIKNNMYMIFATSLERGMKYHRNDKINPKSTFKSNPKITK